MGLDPLRATIPASRSGTDIACPTPPIDPFDRRRCGNSKALRCGAPRKASFQPQTQAVLVGRWKEFSSCGLASFSSPHLESQIQTLGNPFRFPMIGNCSSGGNGRSVLNSSSRWRSKYNAQASSRTTPCWTPRRRASSEPITSNAKVVPRNTWLADLPILHRPRSHSWASLSFCCDSRSSRPCQRVRSWPMQNARKSSTTRLGPGMDTLSCGSLRFGPGLESC